MYSGAMNTQTARNILGCANDADLARELGLSRQAVNQWDGKVPPRWERWVKILERANKRPATVGGSGECCKLDAGGTSNQLGNYT